jgi:GNAT superfamily N-acetyltransferase
VPARRHAAEDVERFARRDHLVTVAPVLDGLRREAARIAAALLRLEAAAAHLQDHATRPGAPRVGTDAFVFLPSTRPVRREEVEAFLAALPSPALLAPTTLRGLVALLLFDELAGDRKRWAEKIASNYAVAIDETATSLGLTPASRVLLEFDDESHVFSFAAVREFSQRFPVQVGWNVAPLEGEARADACMRVRRGDGRPFPGRSCMTSHPHHRGDTKHVILLGPGDARILERMAPDVFDHPLDPRLTAEFLADPRHHLAVSLDGDTVVGFASAVHYVHPDKPAELWINEVGVAPSHRRRGIGRDLLRTLLRTGAAFGCREAWVLTEPDNEAALQLYRSVGGVEAPGGSVMLSLPIQTGHQARDE